MGTSEMNNVKSQIKCRKVTKKIINIKYMYGTKKNGRIISHLPSRNGKKKKKNFKGSFEFRENDVVIWG
jgi:hypothetical protein